MKVIHNIFIFTRFVYTLTSDNLMRDLEFHKVLSQNQSSMAVFQGLYDGEIVGIKLYGAKYTEDCFFIISEEILISFLLIHPNIIAFKNFFLEFDESSCLIYESVELRLSNCSFNSFDDIKIAIKDILLGVRHMHLNNILHNDLNPDSIVKIGSNYKVMDFGSACFYESNKTYSFYFNDNENLHIAPEVKVNGKISYKSDVYSIGFILNVILTKMCESMKHKFIHNNFKLPANPVFSSEFQATQNFYHNLVQILPEQRFTIDEALKNRWFDTIAYKVLPLDNFEDLYDKNNRFKKQGNELLIFEDDSEFLRIKTIDSGLDFSSYHIFVYLYGEQSHLNFLTRPQINKLNEIMKKLKISKP